MAATALAIHFGHSKHFGRRLCQEAAFGIATKARAIRR